MNVNIGGVKGWGGVAEAVRLRWQIMDISGRPDYRYDLNSQTPFPLGDSTIDAYYSSHTLEHVQPDRIAYVVGEMHRTLKVDGRVRVVVPDITIPLKHYLAGDRNWLYTQQNKARVRHGYPNTPLGCLMLWWYSKTKDARSGHNMVFDWDTLACVFSRFRDIRRMSYQHCSEIFAGLDLRRHANSSLYLEAVK